MYWAWQVMARNIPSTKTILAAVSLLFTRIMSLLSIKTQRPADTVRFCNGKKCLSHASGNTKPGWNRSRSRRRLGGADQTFSFNGGRERRFLAGAKSWIVPSPQQWRTFPCNFRIPWFTVLYVLVCSDPQLVESLLHMHFPRMYLSSLSHPWGHFESSYRNTNSFSRLRWSGWADSVNLAALRWVEVPKPEITGSGLLDMP